jgi:RNA polymerase-binding transcription factor DksA
VKKTVIKKKSAAKPAKKEKKPLKAVKSVAKKKVVKSAVAKKATPAKKVAAKKVRVAVKPAKVKANARKAAPKKPVNAVAKAGIKAAAKAKARKAVAAQPAPKKPVKAAPAKIAAGKPGASKSPKMKLSVAKHGAVAVKPGAATKVLPPPPPPPPPAIRHKPAYPAKILKELRESLLAERRRVISELRNLENRTFSNGADEPVTNQPGFSLQMADSAAENTEIEIALGIRSIEADTLAQIDEALRSMDRGDYGYCQGCGEPIELERLRIKPWAQYSVKYLRQQETRRP